MNTYLLACDCGKSVPVEAGQAGGRVVCGCGAELNVPPLRKLRHLPVAAPEGGPAKPAWSARQGVVTVFSLLAIVAALSGLWIRLSEPTVPSFDAADRLRVVDESLKQVTPIQAWQLWIDVYRPLAKQGFSVFEHRDAAAIEQKIVQQRFMQKTLWTIAATCAAVTLAAALWPRSRLAATR